MKMQEYKLSASVLATVLIASTLLLLGTLIIMNVWNMDTLRYRLYHCDQQACTNVESDFCIAHYGVC